jgi:UDP:flavonoid glycosyltransferase YjiC (YdhE family)
LDALAELPVHVVVTTGAGIDPAELDRPANAYVTRFAPHEPVLRRCSLVVTHGGHGTAMRALRRGVPMVCLVGQAADQEGVAALDQPRVAEFVEERGAGWALPADAPVSDIAAAAEKVLGSPEYRSGAQALAAPLAASDGAAIAAARLVALAR